MTEETKDTVNTQPVRVRGKLLKALIKTCCKKTEKGEHERPFDSIGVGQSSVVATDSYMGVALGAPEASYRPTSRKSALLESEREMLYLNLVAFENIEAIADPVTGEMATYPGIGKILDGLEGMQSMGKFTPELLLKAAQIAVAANSSTIELLQHKGKDLLGFRFQVVPDEDQFDLFEGEIPQPIDSCGVLAARRSEAKDEDEPE